MNKNSHICNYINEHPYTWKVDFPSKNISIKEKMIHLGDSEYHLAIFNYEVGADFSDPVVQEARGIIIDLGRLEVVCWPFRKFGNYGESYADDIDWKSARVQDKIDGSIIKAWSLEGWWFFATNGVISAFEAKCSSLVTPNFEELINKADNYHDILWDEMDKNKTYIFELVSPENQIVIKYPTTHLFHIGTRDNITGKESREYIGIDQPKEYNLHSLEDCINAAKSLNTGDVTKEGFVVVDNNWNRIKVKSPDYLYIHRMIGNGNFSKRRVLELLRDTDKEQLDKFVEDYPHYAVYIAYYRFKLLELKEQITGFRAYTLNLYEEYAHERKAVAEDIKNHPFAAFGFQALDGKDFEIENLPISKIEELIPEYSPMRNWIKV